MQRASLGKATLVKESGLCEHKIYITLRSPVILAPWPYRQFEGGRAGGKDTRQCCVPGHQSSKYAQPAAYCGESCASLTSKCSQREEKEGKGQQSEDGNEGNVASQGAKEHHSGKDCPTQQEEAKPCA